MQWQIPLLIAYRLLNPTGSVIVSVSGCGLSLDLVDLKT